MTHNSEYVKQLNQRHASLAWWARVRELHPLGVVPVSTASRILGVSHNRVYTLIKEGRLRMVEGMPGGNDRDRFVPFTDLLDAPYAMTRGKPGTFGPKNRLRTAHEKKLREYTKSLAEKGLSHT